MAGTNGVNGAANAATSYSSSSSPSPSPSTTKVWDRVTQYLPSRNHDSDFWWRYSGLHLAIMLEEAGYTPEKQLEALVFFYHWGAPYMGPAPTTGKKPKWKSLVNPDGTPIEYSWKWSQGSGGPEVRYDIEPIGPNAGTELDPLCQQAAKELMHNLSKSITDTKVDNTVFNHFMATLFEHDNGKLIKAGEAGEPMSSTVLMAAELLPKGVTFKTYIQPHLIGYPFLTPVPIYEQSIKGIDGQTPARDAVHDFLSNDPEGKLMAPFSVGVDNKPGSRLKWYFNSPHTSFASMRQIMTLGGRIQNKHTSRQFADLFALVRAVLGLSDDFPETENAAEFLGAKSPYDFPPPPMANGEDAEAPAAGGQMGFPYYFDVAAGQELANCKWSLPIRNYHRDDRAVAEAFVGWMEKHGRAAYTKNYISMLERLAALKGQKLEESKGLQEFLSVMMRADGELEISTYFSGSAFKDEEQKRRDASSSPGRRGTRKRDSY